MECNKLFNREIRNKYLVAQQKQNPNLEVVKGIVKFLCVPIELWIGISCKISQKIAKKCCKLFSLMINLKCKLLNVFSKKNNFRRRGLKNEKGSRSKRKKKSKKEKKVS